MFYDVRWGQPIFFHYICYQILQKKNKKTKFDYNIYCNKINRGKVYENKYIL